MWLKITVPLLENLLINLVSKKKKKCSTRSEASDHQGIHGKGTQAPIQKQGYLWCSDEHYHGRGGHLPVMVVRGYIVQEVKSHLDYAILLYRTRWWTGRSMWCRASRHGRERRPLPHALYVSGMYLKLLVHDCISLNCDSQTQFTKWGLLCVSKILLYC